MIFELIDKTGRRIHLSKERWSHITIKHPYMSHKLDDIKKTIEKPDFIVQHKFDDNMKNYYHYYKDTKLYLLVVVKYLNGGGYIASAFITRKIMKR